MGAGGDDQIALVKENAMYWYDGGWGCGKAVAKYNGINSSVTHYCFIEKD